MNENISVPTGDEPDNGNSERPKKKLKVDIFDGPIDSNAHYILGRFKKQAMKEGWTIAEAQAVLDEAMDGDYDHLIQTLMKHTE